jgi:SAM-dependent methyltransferase
MNQNPNDPWLPMALPPTSSARLYSAYQGGPAARDAYASDLDLATQIAGLGLDTHLIATQNRAFHNRAVRYCARELGIRQALDIGCGMPAQPRPDTHDIVEDTHPGTSRVLYIDNDPVVVAHARALMRGDRLHATAAAHADLRNPDQILHTAREYLDLTRPVMLLLIAVLHYIPDDDHPQHLVRTLTDALPPGSALVLSHVTDDFAPDTMRQAEELLAGQSVLARTRPRARIEEFFDGLTMLGPGVMSVHQWHQPHPDTAAIPAERIHNYGGIALT